MLFNDNRIIRKGLRRKELPTLTIVRRVTINVTTVALRRNGGRS
jgi:hypothetical protein